MGIEEYRFDCVNRMAYKAINELDDAYSKLITVMFGKGKYTNLPCNANANTDFMALFFF